MYITDLTLDDLFDEGLQSPLYKNIRSVLVRNHITDVDRLRTLSTQRLSRLNPMFTQVPIAKLDARLRLLTNDHGLGSDKSNYGSQRCIGVYGYFGNTPLAMDAFHFGYGPRRIVELILQSTPDIRTHSFEEMTRDELYELVASLASKQDVSLTKEDWSMLSHEFSLADIRLRDDPNRSMWAFDRSHPILRPPALV